MPRNVKQSGIRVWPETRNSDLDASWQEPLKSILLIFFGGGLLNLHVLYFRWDFSFEIVSSPLLSPSSISVLVVDTILP